VIAHACAPDVVIGLGGLIIGAIFTLAFCRLTR
jgi:hypothetical protein